MRLLELEALSDRELRVLELAIEGLTDQQIASTIGIRTSTVNSYWVRIRGKLGHLSRTELVSRVLRQRTTQEDAASTQKIEDLEKKISDLRNSQHVPGVGSLARAAVESCPEAMLVLDSEGQILLASDRAGVLFGGLAAQLNGKDLCSLVQPLEQLWNPQGRLPKNSHTARLGIKVPLYGRRMDGALFRLLLLLSKSGGDPSVWSCVIRPFHEEVDSTLERAAVIISDMA